MYTFDSDTIPYSYFIDHSPYHTLFLLHLPLSITSSTLTVYSPLHNIPLPLLHLPLFITSPTVTWSAPLYTIPSAYCICPSPQHPLPLLHLLLSTLHGICIDFIYKGSLFSIFYNAISTIRSSSTIKLNKIQNKIQHTDMASIPEWQLQLHCNLKYWLIIIYGVKIVHRDLRKMRCGLSSS